jgi:erythromycin esterase-like protein
MTFISNNMRFSLVILFTGLLWSGVYAQDRNFTDRYCLDFSSKKMNFDGWNKLTMGADYYNWRENYQDTTKGRKVLRIEAEISLAPANIGSGIQKFDYRIRLHEFLYSNGKIVLPEGGFKSGARVTLTCRSENLKWLDLVVTGYDRRENILRRDTLHSLDEEKTGAWKTFGKNIPLENVAMLGLMIEAEGIDSTFHKTNYSTGKLYGHKDSTINQLLFLERLDIYLDGKHIDNYPLSGSATFTPADKSDVRLLSFTNERFYAGIPELKTRRIIALGETVHGSETMASIMTGIIRHQVLHNRCKLVVLEKMGEEMLMLNRFVQGDESLHIDTILQPIARPGGSLNSLVSLNQLRELCIWLKEYNRTSDKKVWLTGMDYEWLIFHRRLAIADYLLTLNEWFRYPFINEMCEDLLKVLKDAGTQDIVKTRKLWEENRDLLINVLGRKETDLARHYLSDVPNLPVTGEVGQEKSLLQRDSLMSENLHFLVNLLCDREETAVVYAHFSHVNYVDLRVVTRFSCGYYAKKMFGDDYFHIGITAAQGTCLTMSSLDPSVLQPPVENSIEDYLGRISADFFYAPTSATHDSFSLIRHMGTMYEKTQFEKRYLSPSGRMGGVIFTRNSKAAAFPEILHYYTDIRLDKCRKRLEELKTKTDISR